MAVTAYPLNYGGSVEFTARQGRQAMAALMMPGPGPLRTRSGFRPGGQPTVSVTATTWSVGPLSGIVDTGQSSITGPYLVASDATETGTVTAAHATYARKDILYVQVDDADESDGTGQRRARVLYLAGTAAATPSPQQTPPRSLLIGVVDVPQVGGGAPSYTPSGVYCVAAGGILPVPSRAVRDALAAYEGMVVARLDTGLLETRLGGSWSSVFAPLAPRVSNQIGQPSTFVTGAYTDFTAAQWPAITLTVPPSGAVKITIGAAVMNQNTTSATGWVGWRASGAFTEGTGEKNAVGTAGGRTYASRTVVRDGLTPGSSLTITPQYNVSSAGTVGSTTSVNNGQLLVEPVG